MTTKPTTATKHKITTGPWALCPWCNTAIRKDARRLLVPVKLLRGLVPISDDLDDRGSLGLHLSCAQVLDQRDR